MKKKWITGLCLVFMMLAALILSARQANAQTPNPTPTPAGSSGDAACLECHGKPGLETKLPSGEILYLSIDATTFDHSVHGTKGYACTQCHTDISGFPHPALQATTRRDVSLQLTNVCATCHQDKFAAATNDAHTEARKAGNKEAAVCTDCHGAHDITSLNNPRSRIPQTCEKCHSQIFDLYKNSVHGQALIGFGNADVPSCVDCHNAHNIQGPSNTQFRLFSPQICAKCHANTTLMKKYNINTNVFNTYISDFHGTTVELFQATAPGQETNKPVCIDCHGVHDITAVTDANSSVIRDKLLVTCQKCHPGASPNFPSAWLSHYTPSPQHYPVVYYVGLFYRFFIPSVLGVMALFVVSDAGRRLYNKGKKNKPQAAPPAPPAGPETSPEPQVEQETRPEPEAEIESNLELQAGPETSPTPEVEPEANPGPQTEPETSPEPGPELGSYVEPQAGPESNPAAEVEPEANPKPETGASEEQHND